jgi:hypothetical protein
LNKEISRQMFVRCTKWNAERAQDPYSARCFTLVRQELHDGQMTAFVVQLWSWEVTGKKETVVAYYKASCLLFVLLLKALIEFLYLVYSDIIECYKTFPMRSYTAIVSLLVRSFRSVSSVVDVSLSILHLGWFSNNFRGIWQVGLFKICHNNFFHLHLGLPSSLFLSGVPYKILTSFVHTAYLSHIFLLDLNILIIFSKPKSNRCWSFSLCIFSILHRNISIT